MKLVWVFILFIFCPLTFANEAVEIPRSKTVELTDPASKLVYPVFIKTPRSYRSNTDKVYPVIYLTDGIYSFQIASGATRFPMNSGAMEEAFIACHTPKGRKVHRAVFETTPQAAPMIGNCQLAMLRDTRFSYEK